MRLRALRLWNVRRFAARGVAIEGIGDGVNVLSAPNEAGKSTCFDALHGLLFAKHSAQGGDVRGLRPHSGGSPRIEADLETAEGLFRVSKTYFAGKQALVRDLGSGRVVAQDDAAEAWIERLVRGGAGGPAGLLWVRQGAAELGLGAKTAQETERRAREDVLTSVAGEVETLTGGRRMAQALARCEEDLGVLATATGRPKAHGPWAEAMARAEELEAEVARLAGLLEDLRAALARRHEVRARLAESADPGERAARQAALDAARQALEAARQHAERLAAAEVRLRAADLALAQAAGAEDAFRGRLAGLGRAEMAAGGMRAALAARVAAEAAAREAEQVAVAAVRAGEEALRVARGHVTRAEAAEAAARAAERLEEGRARLAQAEAARDARAADRAERLRLALPEGLVARVAALERDVAEAEARLGAEAVRVVVRYLPGQAGRVVQDGSALPGEAPVPLGAAGRLELDGIGTLDVLAGGGRGAAEACATARAALATALDAAGMADGAALRERVRHLEMLAGRMEREQARLDILAPDGLDALRARVAADAELMRAAGEAGAGEIPGAEAAREARAGAEAGLDRARAALDAARDRRAEAERVGAEARAGLAAAEGEIARLAEELGPEAARDGLAAGLAAERSAAAAEVAAAGEAVRALQAAAPDLASAEAGFARAASAVERVRVETEALERELSGLDATIATRAGDGIEEAHDEALGRHRAARARLDAVAGEVAVLLRLRAALEEARSAAREQYFGPVMAELRPLVALLFEDAAVAFDDATLLPKSVGRGGEIEAVEVLSGGTREQLAILTRLAFARLLAEDGRAMPVVLDDVLVHSDDARIERMFDALHRQAREMQIIVLTCRRRAFERLGGQGLRMEPWVPEAG